MELDKSITETVKEGLDHPTFDLITDYSELALDSFMDNEAIKEIPLVKTIVGTIKGIWKVREMFFAKKFLTFLREFHTGNLKEEKRQQLRINSIQIKNIRKR